MSFILVTKNTNSLVPPKIEDNSSKHYLWKKVRTGRELSPSMPTKVQPHTDLYRVKCEWYCRRTTGGPSVWRFGRVYNESPSIIDTDTRFPQVFNRYSFYKNHPFFSSKIRRVWIDHPPYNLSRSNLVINSFQKRYCWLPDKGLLTRVMQTRSRFSSNQPLRYHLEVP